MQSTRQPAHRLASGISIWLNGYSAGLVSSTLDVFHLLNPVGLLDDPTLHILGSLIAIMKGGPIKLFADVNHMA